LTGLATQTVAHHLIELELAGRVLHHGGQMVSLALTSADTTVPDPDLLDP